MLDPPCLLLKCCQKLQLEQVFSCSDVKTVPRPSELTDHLSEAERKREAGLGSKGLCHQMTKEISNY